MRLLTRHSTLYTEMVVDSAILHNIHQLEDHLGATAEAYYLPSTMSFITDACE